MELEQATVIGQVGPRSDGVDTRFWDGLGEGRLLIQHCSGCGRWVWPAAWSCPGCHGRELDWEEVPAKGRVYTWTRTWQPFIPEFAELVPYVTVVVELDGADGTRLVGILLGDDSRDPELGEPLEGVIQPTSELTSGVPVLRWQRPATAR
jgi:uncharacterized OB-fold protein